MPLSPLVDDPQLFEALVSKLKHELVFRGPVPPKHRAPRIDGQHPSHDGHEHAIASLADVHSQMEFSHSFSIPDTDALQQPHVKCAARHVATFVSDPHALEAERVRKLALLTSCASSLSSINSKALSHASPMGRPIAKRFNVALLLLMAAATDYPDTQLPFDLVQGVPNFGDIPRSGSHAEADVPSTLPQLDPEYAQHLIGTIRKKASSASAEARAAYEVCYDKTVDEVANGWMVGPYSKDETDILFPEGWHPSERFAQFRYPGAPCRPCDNFRTSGINDFNAYHERLVCENAGFPSRVGKYFHSLFSPAFPGSLPPECDMAHGTDDLTKAYRQVVVRDHAHNVIAIWNPYVKRVEFFVIRGLPFGSAAAVLQFNRYTQFIAYFLAAYFGICCTSYYDDYDVTEPLYSVHCAQNILWRLHRAIGFMLDKDKHVRAASSGNAFLGVVTDFASFAQGKILLRISPQRKSKVVAMLLAVVKAQSLTSAQASSLRGKLYFCMLTAFNKVGRGPLRSFTERQYSHATALTSELSEAIQFFLHLIPNMAPRCIDILSSLRSTIIIWSDAMYENWNGALGFVAFDPDDGTYYYSAYEVPRWVYTFFRPLKTYIGQLEILAVLFAYLTLPSGRISNRPVLHYIDNTSSMAGSIKGYSPKSDSSKMLTIMHLVFAYLHIAPWFAYVASKANCSDGPSRLDFDFVTMTLHATYLQPVPLTFAQWSMRIQEWITEKAASTLRQRDSGAQRRARKRKLSCAS